MQATTLVPRQYFEVHPVMSLPAPLLVCAFRHQELARLDEEGRRNRAELAKVVERAERLSKGVNGSLDKLADHMLAAPR